MIKAVLVEKISLFYPIKVRIFASIWGNPENWRKYEPFYPICSADF